MDRLNHYRCLLKQLLQERADLMNSHPIPGIDTLCLFDEQHDEYLVINVGWHNRKRVQYITLFARIHNGKVWVEEDGTEEGLANLMVEAGVSKEDIVIGYDPPELRHLTTYAVA